MWNVYFNIDKTQFKLLINILGIQSNIIYVWNGWWPCVLQEIVGNLVTHFGSGFEEETDSSLDILYYLVDNSMRWRHLQSLSRYSTKFIHLQMRVSIFLTFTGIQRHYILFSVYTCRNLNGNLVLICKIWFVIFRCLNTRTFHVSFLLEDCIFIIFLVFYLMCW